jgi:arylsulfatase A-like enzyme
MIEDLRGKGHDSAGGWRGAKQDLYEGGHRVPFIVRWPGVVAAGSSSDATIGLIDVFATIAAVVGEPLTSEMAEDSVSFLPVLRKPGAPFDRGAALVMQSGTGLFAVREGTWKLCLSPGSGGLSAPRPGSPEEKDLPPVQLFDLQADPREIRNLQAEHPDIVRRLRERLESYRAAGRSRPQ